MRAKIVAVHHVPFVTNNDGSSLAVKRSPTKIAVKHAPLDLSLIFLKVSLQPDFHGVLFEYDEMPYIDYLWEYTSLKDFQKEDKAC